jgi:hypothetical protein
MISDARDGGETFPSCKALKFHDTAKESRFARRPAPLGQQQRGYDAAFRREASVESRRTWAAAVVLGSFSAMP